MTSQEYLTAFQIYAKEVCQQSRPTAKEGSPGGIRYLRSYLESLRENLKTLNDKLVKEANQILADSQSNLEIDRQKLKEDLKAIVDENYNEWVLQYKIKKSN